MHPEILRQIASLQVADQRARAERSRVARTLAKALRGGHPATLESDGFVAPPIPDYVDGSFRTTAAAGVRGDGSPRSKKAQQVSAARTAA